MEDVARVLEVLAGVDPEDALTNVSKSFNTKPANYTKFLQKDGLKVSSNCWIMEVAEQMTGQLLGKIL